MVVPNRRVATIADLMLLIVGTAVAFSGWRFVTSMQIWSGFPDSLQWYHFRALGGVVFLAPVSLTLLVVALRQSRLRPRRVVSEPAGLVGITASSVLVANTVLLLAIWVLVGWSIATFSDGKIIYFCRLLAEQTGMAIGAAWALQWLNGRCRRPAGWVDVFAWVVGACWIVLALASAVFTLL